MSLRRVFGAYAYGDGPRTGCWWDETCALPELPRLEGDADADVAIVGAGFTGLSAALRLAETGLRVIVLEACRVGWGASGRNGGFCCLGGSKASDAQLDARYGKAGRLAWRRTEKEAVAFVDDLIARFGMEVDRHSEGETQLAHSPAAAERLRAEQDAVAENYGVAPEFLDAGRLGAHGFGSGAFFGALTVPLGFGINPRKYLAGLLAAARAAGAQVMERSEVTAWNLRSGAHRLRTASGSVRAGRVILATNGYSSETLPRWLAGRYMPAQSTVLVTRPLTEAERAEQGWTSGQMCYDTRNMLHYFRMMPDGRFLFGMRGGLLSGARAEAAARSRTRRDFERMFPAWAGVESVHSWSGFVCLSRSRMPFVGALPNLPDAWAAMCYHGNGVAMGSYAGRMVADLALKRDAGSVPAMLREPLVRFPLGRARRLLMPPLYASLWLQDMS